MALPNVSDPVDGGGSPLRSLHSVPLSLGQVWLDWQLLLVPSEDLAFRRFRQKMCIEILQIWPNCSDFPWWHMTPWMLLFSQKLCPTLHDRMDCSPPGSSVHGISQARTLEWVAASSSRGSFQPRNQTWVSCDSCSAGRFFYCCRPIKLCAILEVKC